MSHPRRRHAGYEWTRAARRADAARADNPDRHHYRAAGREHPLARARRRRGGLPVQAVQRHRTARRGQRRAREELMTTPVVFVVDDDVSVRESLELLITCAGWRPETFASAREFLEDLARTRARGAGCLVLDVSLPDLNGLELQQRLAGGRTHLPIIFITGYGDVPT